MGLIIATNPLGSLNYHMIRVTVYKNIKIGVSLGIYWTERDGKRGFGIPLDAPGTDFREVPRESPEMV